MTDPTDAEPGIGYLVVVNHEEQFSIWEDELPLPAGWRHEGFAGTRADCLDHIGRTWTDMRPLSLRTAD